MVLAEPRVHLDSVPNPSVALIQHRKPKSDKRWGLGRTSSFPGRKICPEGARPAGRGGGPGQLWVQPLEGQEGTCAPGPGRDWAQQRAGSELQRSELRSCSSSSPGTSLGQSRAPTSHPTGKTRQEIGGSPRSVIHTGQPPPTKDTLGGDCTAGKSLGSRPSFKRSRELPPGTTSQLPASLLHQS